MLRFDGIISRRFYLLLLCNHYQVKKMDGQKYFDRMRETSEAVDATILEALLPLREENQAMYNAVMALPNKRMGLPKSRAHLAREAYVICDGSDDDNWIPLATASELLLNSMYYKNQVFDGKAGYSISKGDAAFKNWIADSYSRDLAGRLLQEAYQGKPQISELLRSTNMVCVDGAWIDIFQNTYQQTKNLTFDEQISLCNDRMYKMNASFFEKIAIMGAIAANESDNSKISALSDFGKEYGMGLQAVNDIADFVPPRLNSGTAEKIKGDTYRDIILGKMTYPTIWLLHNGTSKEKDLAHKIFQIGEKASLEELEKLTKTLIDSEAIDFAKQKVKDFKNKAKRALHNYFPKKERAYLSTMCTMFDKNRYYDALKEMAS